MFDDIVLDDNAELQLENDDFLVGDAANNYIRNIVTAHPGHYKEFPTLGVGASSLLHSDLNPQQIERAIRLQLEGDIFKKPDIDVSRFPIIEINQIELDLGT